MACRRGRILANHSSSVSNTPQSAPFDCSSDVATPESRFAPVRLQTTVFPLASITSASRFVVVVLPFVPTTTTDPSRRRVARCAITSGSTYSATLPGKLAAGRWNTCLSPHVETALMPRAAANCNPILHLRCFVLDERDQYKPTAGRIRAHRHVHAGCDRNSARFALHLPSPFGILHVRASQRSRMPTWLSW